MIISSILENDLYKFSMSYYYQVHYPKAWGTFNFHDLNNTKYSEEFVVALKEELEAIAAKVEDPKTGIEDIDKYIKRSEELVAACRDYLRGAREKLNQ